MLKCYPKFIRCNYREKSTSNEINQSSDEFKFLSEVNNADYEADSIFIAGPNVLIDNTDEQNWDADKSLFTFNEEPHRVESVHSNETQNMLHFDMNIDVSNAC